MSIISSLVVALTATTSDFEKGLESAEKRLDRFAAKFDRVGSDLSERLTAPILALGTAAVKFATDFDDDLSKMGATLGQTSGQMRAMHNAVLALSVSTAQGPRDLASALNDIEGAGIRGAAAVDVLRVAAKGATIGLGDVRGVASSLTAVINAYGAGNINAAQATSVLVAAIREGRVRGTEFAGALGPLLPIAASLHMSFDQLAAGMAAMTRMGLDAGQASAALRTVLETLQKPSSAAQAALAEVGIRAGDLRAELQSNGLLATLQTLQKAFEGNEGALNKVFPSARTLAGVLSLMGVNAKDAEGIFGRLADTTTGTLNTAFEGAAKGPGFKFRQALESMEVVLIRLGDVILPRVLPYVAAFAAAMMRLADAFAALSPAAQGWLVVLAAMAAVLGPTVLAVGAFYAALGSAAGALALAGRVGTVVFGGLTSLGTALAGVLNLIVVTVGDLLAGAMVPLFAAITGPGLLAFGLMAAAAYMIASKWAALRDDLAVIFRWIAEQARDLFGNKIIDYIAGFATYAADLLRAFGLKVQTTMAPAWDAIRDGAAAAVTGGKKSLEDGLSGMYGTVKAWGAKIQGAVGGFGAGLPGLGAAAPEGGKDPQKYAPPAEAAGLWDRFRESVAGARQSMSAFSAAFIPEESQISSQMRSMATTGVQGMGALTASFASGKIGLGQFVQGMIQMIEQLIIKLILYKAIASSLGGPFASGFVGGFSPPHFAGGGRPPVGTPYMVGEHGPELRMDDVPGTIIPNGALGGGGGGVTVQVVQHFQVQGLDLSGTDAARQVLRALKDEVKSGSADGIDFALRTKRLADQNAGRAA